MRGCERDTGVGGQRTGVGGLRMARQKTEMCTEKNKYRNHSPCPGGADDLEVRRSPEHGRKGDIRAMSVVLGKLSLEGAVGFP